MQHHTNKTLRYKEVHSASGHRSLKVTVGLSALSTTSKGASLRKSFAVGVSAGNEMYTSQIFQGYTPSFKKCNNKSFNSTGIVRLFSFC